MNPIAARQYIEWLAKNDPFLFEVAKKKYQKDNPSLSGFTDWISSINITDFAKSAVNTITDLAPKVMQLKQQKEVMDLQLQQLKNGAAPIPNINYTPTVNTANAAPAEVEKAAAVTASNIPDNLKVPLMIGGAAILFMMLKKGR